MLCWVKRYLTKYVGVPENPKNLLSGTVPLEFPAEQSVSEAPLAPPRINTSFIKFGGYKTFPSPSFPKMSTPLNSRVLGLHEVTY